jgi:hypothetical protein
VIRFSAGLVVVALGVLIGGVVTSKLSLVYVSIAVSVLALIAWAIGVFLKRGELREELFGGRTELVPAGAGVGAGLSAPGRPASAAQSSASSPASAAPSSGQDRPARDLRDDGFDAAAFSAGNHVSPTWTPKEPGRKPVPDRSPAPAGGWGATSTPPAGMPAVAPRARDGAQEPPAPSPVPPMPASTGSTSADAGSAGALRSWFDRPAPAKPSAPLEDTAPPEATSAPEPADPVVTPAMATIPDPTAADETAAPADDDAPSVTDTDTSPGDVGVPADDDDWPTRYSWLDDEEADVAVESDDVALESDDAVAAELEASEPAKPTSPDAPKSADARADAEEAAAKHADAEETAASLDAHSALEGTDAADDPPVLPSATDPDPGETAEAEPSAEAEPAPSAEAEPAPSAEAEPAPGDAGPPAEQESGGPKLVTVVPGVPRYHEPGCILIRFMPEGDVQQKSISEAKAAKCTPCAACQPED